MMMLQLSHHFALCATMMLEWLDLGLQYESMIELAVALRTQLTDRQARVSDLSYSSQMGLRRQLA